MENYSNLLTLITNKEKRLKNEKLALEKLKKYKPLFLEKLKDSKEKESSLSKKISKMTNNFANLNEAKEQHKQGKKEIAKGYIMTIIFDVFGALVFFSAPGVHAISNVGFIIFLAIMSSIFIGGSYCGTHYFTYKNFIKTYEDPKTQENLNELKSQHKEYNEKKKFYQSYLKDANNKRIQSEFNILKFESEIDELNSIKDLIISVFGKSFFEDPRVQRLLPSISKDEWKRALERK